MAHRTFRSVRGGRSQRRETVWGGISFFETTIATTSTAVLITSLSAGFLAMRPFTIIRTHIHLWLRSDQAAAQEFQRAALGAAVVSDQSVAIGVTAVPTPITDSDSDLWFLHQFWAAPVRIGTDATGIYRAAYQVEFDSKAMRRLTGDESIVVVVENGSAANGAQYNLSFRMLLKVS